jgi:hypothetical protein
MLTSLAIRRPVLVATLLGTAIGFAFGQYRVAVTIADMKEHWGWVCGTGLQEQLLFLTIAGAFIGATVGIGVRVTRRSVSQEPS